MHCKDANVYFFGSWNFAIFSVIAQSLSPDKETQISLIRSIL